MIVQRLFSYLRELKSLNGSGSLFKDVLSSPKRLDSAKKLSSKSMIQWQKVVKNTAPGSTRRDIVNRAYQKRAKEIDEARKKISQRPWES